jgi:hypothetical protein
MTDNNKREPGDSPGPNINRAGDGARAGLEQGTAQQPSADLEQRGGRGVRKGNTPVAVNILYYFAGPR